MAWRSYGQDKTDEKTKRVDRIDRLLSQLNIFWISPLNKDYLTDRYNYNIIFSILKTLSLEISPEMDDKEAKIEKELREGVESFIKENSIHKIKRSDSLGGKKKSLSINYKNWDELEGKLYKYDRFIRKLLMEHLGEKIFGEDLEESDTTAIIAEGEEY